MVRHVHDGRDYWTLPGGGVEPNESPEQAAEREILEEPRVSVTTERFLFKSSSKSGRNSSCCFLMSEPESMAIKIGSDPEQAHLRTEDRMLQDVKWHSISTLETDFMVARVLELLAQ